MIFTRSVVACLWPDRCRLLLIMKLTIFLSFVLTFHAFAEGRAQKITLNVQNTTLREVMKEIKKQQGYSFFFRGEDIARIRLSADIKQADFNDAMNQLLAGRNLEWHMEEKTIIIAESSDRYIAVVPPEEVVTQQQMLRGTVINDRGEPLGGVTVTVKNTRTATVTDAKGNYRIQVQRNGKVLVFSMLGYATVEQEIGYQTEINLSLQPSLSDLDEIIVVGYGTQTKKDITGSIATVSGNEITDRSVSNLSTALQGAVAGLSITRGGSAPGSSGSILLRGITTLEGSSDPLILVDDVPVSSIDDVNPDQIESISILKDGASAAIYGSRAAAGVIIITTKRAKSNSFLVNYSGEQIVTLPTTVPNTVGPVRYMEIYNEYAWNDTGNGADHYPAYGQELIADYANLNRQNPDQYPITDWPDLIMKDRSSGYRHSVTLSGGTDRVKTIGTFGYEKQDALYDHRDWERYTARINNDVTINERFGALFDFAYRVATSDQPSLDPTMNAYRYAPIYAAIWSDGRTAEGKQGDNLYAMLHEGGFSSNNTYKLNGKFGVFYKPFQGLKLSANLAPRYDFTRYKSFNRTIPYWAYDDPMKIQAPKYISGHNDKQSTLIESRDFYRTITAQGMANYDKRINEHHFSGVIGFETFTSETEQLNVIGREYISGDYPYLNQAPVDRVFDNGTGISELAYASYFGRLDYNYNSRYYVQANIRRDGSSRFSTKYRWGTFPSLSAGWILSEESFLKNRNSPFNFAKVRLSYGSLGNDRLGNYLYLSTLQFMNALFTNGSTVVSQYTAAQRYLAIEDITWETTITANIGIDLAMFNNKLSLTADYYHKNTRNMLLNVSIPELTGYEDPMDNVGGMHTKGWEVSASWKYRIGALNYALSFNLFDSKSIIGDIQGKRIIGSTTLSEQGSEYNAWYGYRSDGLYQSQEEADGSATTNANVKAGDIRYVDISGPDGVPDGLINESDRTLLGGTTLPRYQYGGTLRLGYKGVDLGLTIQGVGMQKYYLADTYVRPFMASWFSPAAIIDGQYWSHYHTAEENLQAKYPRLSQNSVNNNYTFSDYWLINGAYLRVKNLALGYNLPRKILQKAGVSNLRIYLSGNDIFSLNKFPKGIDPEYRGGYLVTKSYQLGVNLMF